MLVASLSFNQMIKNTKSVPILAILKYLLLDFHDKSMPTTFTTVTQRLFYV